jgi:2Fe-2S ferredoxin
MPKLFVTKRSGDTRMIEGKAGLTVMEVIRDSGLDEILALCDGARSCATCHVFVDQDDIQRLAEMPLEEREMLDFSEHRQSTSRLSCQIPFTNSLDGLRITIAPDE